MDTPASAAPSRPKRTSKVPSAQEKRRLEGDAAEKNKPLMEIGRAHV